MKLKSIFMIFCAIAAFMGCNNLSIPTEVTGGGLSGPQATQTAVALQTAGLTAQQTATAAATQTAGAIVTINSGALVSVPGGTYTQTDTEGNSFQHTISAFRMGKYEVTYELWYEVRQWALLNGYTFANAGREGCIGSIGLAPTYIKYEPVTQINWRDAIVWCNAYSQKSGLTPVYCSDAGFTTPIKASSGIDSINTTPGSYDNPYVNWSANGYRLPTEGEWQYAASYKDGVSWTPYNYASGATASYDDLMATGFVAWYLGNSWDDRSYYVGWIAHNAGGKNANALGIHDMSGNVWEWCYDWYGTYPGTVVNYRGPASGSGRVMRGGSFSSGMLNLQVGYRSSFSNGANDAFGHIGFRFVRAH